MKNKILFTPGPLTTSQSVKETMLVDIGSRDYEFKEIINSIQEKLLKIGNLQKNEGYEAIIMQGSGTFGVESVISSVIPSNGNLIVLSNGHYGERMIDIAKIYGINVIEYKFNENEPINPSVLDNLFQYHPKIDFLACVHCETTTGILNPINEVGKYAKKYGIKYIVDAMSSFGAYPINMIEDNIDFLISSANKCIEGVPGFSFIIAKRDSLIDSKDIMRNLSLNLYQQWEYTEKNQQFRFTPPIHSMIAFNQALKELEDEGGVEGRALRYKENHQILIEGMRKLGFDEYINPNFQSYIITTFLYPEWNDRKFNFNEFYDFLNERGFVIYPGKLSQKDCFRIGNIGRIFAQDIRNLLSAIEEFVDTYKK